MTALEQLTARMPLLAEADHPLGLREARAEEFSRAVSANGDVAAALRRSGATEQLAAVLSVAKPSDPVQLILRLLPPLGETAVLERAMRAAATYPLVLLTSFAIAGWAIFSVSLPALVQVAALRSVDLSNTQALQVSVIGGCAAFLVLLSTLVFRGAAIPGVSRGTQVLDRVRVLETAAVLVELQTPLPVALTAACAWARGATRTAGEALGHALRGGTPPIGGHPLLSAEGAAILFASAQRGVAAPVLRALAEQSLIEARRLVPQQVRRINAVALTLAGLSLLALAAGWYQTYLHAVTG